MTHKKPRKQYPPKPKPEILRLSTPQGLFGFKKMSELAKTEGKDGLAKELRRLHLTWEPDEEPESSLAEIKERLRRHREGAD